MAFQLCYFTSGGIPLKDALQMQWRDFDRYYRLLNEQKKREEAAIK